MKSWIHLAKGQVPRQARVGVGELKEDLLGRQGFFGRAAELYHLHGPTAWTRIEGNLRPWDIDGYQLKPNDQSDPQGESLRVFYNVDVSLTISRRSPSRTVRASSIHARTNVARLIPCSSDSHPAYRLCSS